MTDFTSLPDALAALIEALRAAKPASPDDMLSPKQAAARLGGLGIKAGVFWLRERGLVTTIPGVEFGKHRTTDVQLVRWGDVLEAVAAYRRGEERKPRRARVGLAEGGLG